MQECNPTLTPMMVPCNLSIEDIPKTLEKIQFMNTNPYRQILGSIRYLVSCKRPNLLFSACYLSRLCKIMVLNIGSSQENVKVPQAHERYGDNCKRCRAEASMKTEKQKRRKRRFNGKLGVNAQYVGETEREREREREKTQKTIFKNSNCILYYMCVCSMHTFYTSPYKD